MSPLGVLIPAAPPDPPGGAEPVAPTDRPVGLPARPRRRRPSLHGWITIGIVALAALACTWGLARNGWANDYYAAAVRAGSVDWKAFLFGSIDPGNVITVDKPPAALWLMALSVRVFGFNPWSMLLPEAACGVASVLVLHHLVRRWAGDVVAHVAALAFAVTPVAVLMFRFNNPDALLTLLCLGAAWGVWSALESGRTRGLLVAAALIGLAFTTKMLQAYVVVPALAGVYLWAGPPRLARRLLQLGAAMVTVLVASFWWVALVTLWPAGSRPYIGGSEGNSVLNLIFGYNGLSRILGGEGPGARGGGGAGGGAGLAGPGGGGPGGTGFGGAPGWLRMFNPANGGQVSWLIPLALAGLAAGLWITRRVPRTDLRRAGWVLWGGWTLLCLVTFSRAEGIFHPYYSVQLAPGVAALTAAAGPALWGLGRERRWLRWCLPAAVALTAAWSVALLERTPTYLPGLRLVVIAGAALAVVALWVGWALRRREAVMVAGAAAVVALLAGPAAYSWTTSTTPVAGSIVAAGPVTDGGFGGFGRGGGAGRGQPVDAGLVGYLQANRGEATFLVATFGSQSSAPIIIATGEPVVTIGGFNGGDPAPTLAQIQQMVADGRLRYLLVGGDGLGGTGGAFGGGGPGGGFGGGGAGRGANQEISQWAAEQGTVVPASAYGGTGTSILYDLAGAG